MQRITSRSGVAGIAVIGAVLIGLGIFGLVWGGFSYTTTEKVVDIGPIHATRDKTHNVDLPPNARLAFGAISLLGGLALLLTARKA